MQSQHLQQLDNKVKILAEKPKKAVTQGTNEHKNSNNNKTQPTEIHKGEENKTNRKKNK